MFERITTSISKNGGRVKSVTIKVKVNPSSPKGSWGVADIQLQEGSMSTEYTEHVAEMERVKENN